MPVLKKNIAGFYDANGQFRPIRSPQYVGTGRGTRKATVRDKKAYSKAKAGDLGKERQERALEAPWDRDFRLEQEAIAADRKERERIEKEIAGEVYGETSGRNSRGKALTLAQFVRSEGGINTKKRIRRGRQRFGDLENFTLKGSGTTGLVTTKEGKGKSLDYMFQAAREAGYDLNDMDDLLHRLDNEIRSGSAMYSTHGSLAYNPAAKLVGANAADLAKARKLGRDHGKAGLPYRESNQPLKQLLWSKPFSVIALNQLIDAFDAGHKPEYQKANPASPARLAKAAISALDTDLDLDVDARDVRRLQKGARAIRKNPAVAQTILQQLGGNKFLVMTGAKNLGHTKNSLQFKLPANFATDGINFVKITLNGRDLYDVEFGKLRGLKYTVIKIDKDIYADILRDLFTRRTGLDTSLGTMGRRNPAAKKNPDPLGMFANAAVGIASALQIKDYLNQPKKKVRAASGKNTAARSRRKNPAGEHWLLTIGNADKIDSVYITNGKTDSQRFASVQAAKAYAAKHNIKLVKNPKESVSMTKTRRPAVKANPSDKVYRVTYKNWGLSGSVPFTSRSEAEKFAKQLEAKAEHSEVKIVSRSRTKSNPRSASVKKAAAGSAKANPRVIQLPVGFHWKKRQAAGGGEYFEITDPKGLIVGWGTTRTNALRTFKTYGVRARARDGFSKDRAKQIRDGARSIRLPARKNPIRIKLHKFYVGQKLATRFIGDNDLILRGEVISRTPKFVTVKVEGDRDLKRCGVSVWDNTEVIYPTGRYSMAPSFRASEGAKANPERCLRCRKMTSEGTFDMNAGYCNACFKLKTAKSPAFKSKKAARKNPAKVPHRKTFEMFNGRPATKAKAMPVSRLAPARLDQLGDLIELKLKGGKVLKFDKRKFKLAAAGGKLWIVGGKVAAADSKQKANVINPIAEIDHVVYGTTKPHHGDNSYTHYIHKLGEESGLRPILCVDHEGFPIVRGGNYKIEARGIVD